MPHSFYRIRDYRRGVVGNECVEVGVEMSNKLKPCQFCGCEYTKDDDDYWWAGEHECPKCEKRMIKYLRKVAKMDAEVEGDA